MGNFLNRISSSISERDQDYSVPDLPCILHNDDSLFGRYGNQNIIQRPKPHMANSPKWEAIKAMWKKHEGSIDEHFHIIRKIGEGGIGKVYLCRLEETQMFFVLKEMNKRSLQSIANEIEILQMLDHPFLPTLYHNFEKSDGDVVLVMDYCSGGDLLDIQRLHPRGCLSEIDTRFYASEILIALEYLHVQGIVHRDLKPENILIREDGHIVLTDFNLSKKGDFNPTMTTLPIYGSSVSRKDGLESVDDPRNSEGSCRRTLKQFMESYKRIHHNVEQKKQQTPNELSSFPEILTEPTSIRSLSIVGTAEYLAPEVVEGLGYGSAVDWWALGILLYELLYGTTPFLGPEKIYTYQNIVGKAPVFPECEGVSDAAKDLISQLLVKDPTKRLGYGRGAAEVKNHAFFNGVNWTLIFKSIPPVIPGPYCCQNRKISHL